MGTPDTGLDPPDTGLDPPDIGPVEPDVSPGLPDTGLSTPPDTGLGLLGTPPDTGLGTPGPPGPPDPCLLGTPATSPSCPCPVVKLSLRVHGAVSSLLSAPGPAHSSRPRYCEALLSSMRDLLVDLQRSMVSLSL